MDAVGGLEAKDSNARTVRGLPEVLYESYTEAYDNTDPDSVQ
jgi:hypothetical protein